ncbi:threonine-phosphate decarboxylase CobD [Fulvimarina sp. MAC8]|uniref:threonine-phosphate decarboxylase CobD n=1 Tax=Fulvimarina sp. MAC8 TaxID=3162874 RepID=UPI0032EF9C81
MSDTSPGSMDHGGALDAAIARFGGKREDWLDLSTGINPSPPDIPILTASSWARLPEAGAEQCLVDAARSFYGARNAAGIAIAPGSQALISLLPFLLPPAIVAVLDPTYSEHTRAFEAAGHDVRRFHELTDIPSEASFVVLVNPNNPDGRRFEPHSMLALAERLAAKGGWLVVDEAFADTETEISLAPHAGREGLVIYRSFGKFTGLAGLRLGFALTTPELAQQLAARLGPWAVSSPAIALGTAVLQNETIIDILRRDIASQSARLVSVVASQGLDIIGGTPLFKTIHHPHAQRLHRALCERHILTRAFDYAPDWLRFGNPRDDGVASRLETALAESLAEIGAPPGDAPDEPG